MPGAPNYGFRPPAAWGSVGEVDRYNLVDLNGDGLPDLIFHDSNYDFRVFLNTGTGFADAVTWGHAGDLSPLGYSLADVNGDGLPDVVYDSVDQNGNNTGIKVLVNTGNKFMSPKKWGTRGGDYSTPTFQMADVNRDGLADFVYDAKVGSSHEIRVIPAGQYNPNWASDLLNYDYLGTGGQHWIYYAPTEVVPSRYSPYSIQMPSTLSAYDGLNWHATSWVRYGGCYDYASREYRGVSQTVETRPDMSTVASSYYQDDVYKGLLSYQAIYDSTWAPFTHSYNFYQDQAPPNSGTHFPALIGRVTLVNDGVPSFRQITTSYAYDNTNGNMTSRYQLGYGYSTTDNPRYDEIDYYPGDSDGNWLLARPSVHVIHTRKYEGGTQDDDLARTTFTYNPGTNLVTSKAFWYDLGTADPTIYYTTMPTGISEHRPTRTATSLRSPMIRLSPSRPS